MKALGLSPGGSSQKAVVRRALELELDVSRLGAVTAPLPRKSRHASLPQFDHDEVLAIGESASTWTEFRDALGFSGGSGYVAAQRVASEHGLPVDHFRTRTDPSPMPASERVAEDFPGSPQEQHLRFAATAVATSWFMERGYMVSLPVEPAIYDLVAETATGLRRVQVKSTNAKERGSGHWICRIGRRPYRSGNQFAPMVPYSANDIDYFFIVCGDGSVYLIPIDVVDGLLSVTLGLKYQAFAA